MSEFIKNINQSEKLEKQIDPKEYFNEIKEKAQVLPWAINEQTLNLILGIRKGESSMGRFSPEWNDPERYIDLTQYLLLHIPQLSVDKIQELITKISENKNNVIPAEEHKQVDKIYLNWEGREVFIQSIVNNRLGNGLQLTEIGGLVMKPLAAALGCESQDDGKNTISLNNWQKILKKDQDIVVTCRVLDYGSGIGGIAEPKYEDVNKMFFPDDLGALELLMVLYNITKKGGVSLNDDFDCSLDNEIKSRIQKNEMLKMIGWEICPKELQPYNKIGNITTMVKTRPEIDKIKLGLKTAIYNETEDIWQLQESK